MSSASRRMTSDPCWPCLDAREAALARPPPAWIQKLRPPLIQPARPPCQPGRIRAGCLARPALQVNGELLQQSWGLSGAEGGACHPLSGVGRRGWGSSVLGLCLVVQCRSFTHKRSSEQVQSALLLLLVCWLRKPQISRVVVWRWFLPRVETGCSGGHQKTGPCP